MQHRLSQVSVENMTAICKVCGPVKIKPSYRYKKSGKMMYRCKARWRRFEKKRYKEKKFPYIKYKKDRCESCRFIPVHTCQLDVDHIDGNRDNNNPSNLRTLCANCHRLKTFQNKDWIKQK